MPEPTQDEMDAQNAWALARGFDLLAHHWNDLDATTQMMVRRIVANTRDLYTPPPDAALRPTEPTPEPEPVAWTLRFKPTGKVCAWLVNQSREMMCMACVAHNEDSEDAPYEVIPLYAETNAPPTPEPSGLLERLNTAYFTHVGAVGNDRVNDLVELVRDAHTVLSALSREPTPEQGRVETREGA